MVKRREILSYKGSSASERESLRLGGNLAGAQKFLVLEWRGDGGRFFLMVPSERTGGNGDRLEYRELPESPVGYYYLLI